MQDDLSFDFDKFMVDITKREQSSTPIQNNREELTSQREYIKRYGELPQNRIVWEK
jgi:hypothetical protein